MCDVTGPGRAARLPALDALAPAAPAGRAAHPALPFEFEFEFELELPAALSRARKRRPKFWVVNLRILNCSGYPRDVFSITRDCPIEPEGFSYRVRIDIAT